MRCLTFGMPGGLIWGLVKHTAVRQGSKTSGQSVESDLFSRKRVLGEVNIIQTSGNFRRVSQFCVEADIFRPLLRVFSPSLRVFMYVPRHQQGGKARRTAKRKEERMRSFWEG